MLLNPYPIFRASCTVCNATHWSTTLAPSDKPFTYQCVTHLSPRDRTDQERHNGAEFNRLDENTKRRVRITLFGVSETREIEARGQRIARRAAERTDW